MNKETIFTEQDQLESISELTLSNVNSFWKDRDCQPVIKEISLHAKPGTVTIVIGKVGSGKSSLLFTILNETP